PRLTEADDRRHSVEAVQRPDCCGYTGYMLGMCKLCKTESELQNSHLLAAGFYRLLRVPEANDPNPIRIDAKITTFTSDQVTRHLLCAGCEDRFNRNGERSEEHTSELQSRFDLVCRLLLEKK